MKKKNNSAYVNILLKIYGALNKGKNLFSQWQSALSAFAANEFPAGRVLLH